MRLHVDYRIEYQCEDATGEILQLKLQPKSRANQTLMHWSISSEGARPLMAIEDAHMNRVDLYSRTEGATVITIDCSGVVEVEDWHGALGAHAGYLPLWAYQRASDRTTPGEYTQRLIDGMPAGTAALDTMRWLAERVNDQVKPQPHYWEGWAPAEEVLAAGKGDLRDRMNVYLTAARAMSWPARYVAGYRIGAETDLAGQHSWAEIHIPDTGWVGFDIDKGLPPDGGYVRVACGRDYSDVLPVSLSRPGRAVGRVEVSVHVSG